MTQFIVLVTAAHKVTNKYELTSYYVQGTRLAGLCPKMGRHHLSFHKAFYLDGGTGHTFEQNHHQMSYAGVGLEKLCCVATGQAGKRWH